MFIQGKLFRALFEPSLFTGPEILCNIEGDGSGGGGGGTGGGGTGGGTNNGGLTQDAWDAIEGRFTTMLQGTASSLVKRMEKQQGEKLDELKKLMEGLKAPAADPDAAGKGKNKNGPDDVTFSTMQQQLQTQRDMLETLKRERDAERQKNRTANLVQASSRYLQEVNITDPINQDLAITNLIAKGILGYESDDSDRIVWRSNGDAYDAREGFRQWARTPEAQRLLPAAGTRGSGSAPGGRGNAGGGSTLTPDEIARNAWRALGDNIDQ